MGLFGSARRIAELQQQSNIVQGGRKEIFQIRDRLRGTEQFSRVFYNVVKDCNHPPMKIIGNYVDHSFWSFAWESATNNYEPYSTFKHQDINIGYLESCAIFLLIQECFPNVYDFPNKTLAQIQNGEVIELVMKKNFVGKKLIPAVTPQPMKVDVAPQGEAIGEGDTMFCSNCGVKINKGVNFCPSCGNKM